MKQLTILISVTVLLISLLFTTSLFAATAPDIRITISCTIQDPVEDVCAEGFVDENLDILIVEQNGNKIQSVEWNLGDGTSLTTYREEIIHVYQEPGIYSVSAAVTVAGFPDPVNAVSENFTISSIVDGSVSVDTIISGADKMQLQIIPVVQDGNPSWQSTFIRGSFTEAYCGFGIDFGDGTTSGGNWEVGPSNGYEPVIYPEEAFVHTYQVPGTYSLQVTATCDGDGEELAVRPDLNSTQQIIIGETDSIKIDFEEIKTGSHATILSQGLIFSPVYVSDLLIRDNNTQALQPRWGDELVIRSEDNSAFDLNSFDYRSQWAGVGGTAVIKGYFADGSKLSDNIIHTGDTSSALTKTLNWKSLVRVEIDFETTVQLDNLDIGGSQPPTSALIDFEEIATGSHPSITTEEMLFTPAQASDVLIRDNNTQALQPRWGDVLRISRVDNSPFDLASFDYRSQWSGVGGTAAITGFLADGSTVTDSFTHSGDTTTTATKTLNWNNLVRVEIDFETTVQLDNFALGDTPPTTSIITFEEIVTGSYPSVSSKGFNFIPVYTSDVLVRDSHTQALQPRWGDVLAITSSDGSTFDLASFDYRSQWSGVGGTAMITGFLDDGSTVTDSFTHSRDTTTAATKTLNWSNLVRVEIDFETTVQLDNFALGDTSPTTSIITFEEIVTGRYPLLTSQEIKFSSADNRPVLIRDTDTQALQPLWNDMLLISRNDGSVFNLASFDYRKQWPSLSGTVLITGYQSDGSVLTDNFSYDGNTGTTTKTLNWVELSSVAMQFEGTAQLDNFILNDNSSVKSWTNPAELHPGQLLQAPATGDIVTVWQEGYQLWSESYNRITGIYDSLLIGNIHPTQGWGFGSQGWDNRFFDSKSTRSVIDPFGNATAVWKTESGGKDKIYARTFSKRAGTNRQLIVEATDPAVKLTVPHTVVDASGNITVLWAQHTEETRSLWASRRTSQGWETPRELLQFANTGGDEFENEYNHLIHSVYPASVAVDSTGKVMVIAVSSELNVTDVSYGGDSIIHAIEFTPANGWGIPQELDTYSMSSGRFGYDDLYQLSFRYSLTGNGILLTGYSQSAPFVEDKYLNSRYFSHDSGWGASEAAAIQQTGDLSQTDYPLLNATAFDSEGNPVVVYQLYNYDYLSDSIVNSLISKQYVPGTGWTAPKTIPTDTGANGSPERFRLFSNKSGDIALLSGDEIRHYKPVNEWSDPVSKAEIKTALSSKHQFAISPSGDHAMLTWYLDGKIHYVSWQSNLGWGQTVSFTANVELFHNLLLDNSGNATLFWRSDASIYTSSYR